MQTLIRPADSPELIVEVLTIGSMAMMRVSSLLTIFSTCLLVWKAEALVVQRGNGSKARQDNCLQFSFAGRPLSAFNSDKDDHERSASYSRRGFLISVPFFTLPLIVSQPSFAEEERKNKILVLGGTGFVGSLVVQVLSDMGIDTIATSRNGRDGTVPLDFTKEGVAQKVQRLASGCTAVISCVGVIGTKNDDVVNAGTGIAAQAAKAAGVKRFVYITVAPEVKEFARDIDFLQDYMAGKTFSRDAVMEAYQDQAVLIEPTFIYGGGSFELNPPRVAKIYGKFIEGILSSSPIRNVERVLSPGFFKIALEPPVPVEDVANAAVAGALGETLPILDSYDKIKQASAQLS